MPSDIDTRLDAIEALLSDAMPSGVEFGRNTVVPAEIPAAGLVILREEDVPAPEHLFPLTYDYDLQVSVEIYAQAAQDGQDITAPIKAAIGAAIIADRGLGGLCDWVEALPDRADMQRVPGAEAIRVDVIRIEMSFSTTQPLG